MFHLALLLQNSFNKQTKPDITLCDIRNFFLKNIVRFIMSSKKITKYDLVEAVYQNSDLEKKQIQNVVDLLLDELKKSLKEGNNIELRGFGTFETRLRKGRSKARNPKTGEILSVAPHYVAAFRSGQELKKALFDLPVESKE